MVRKPESWRKRQTKTEPIVGTGLSFTPVRFGLPLVEAAGTGAAGARLSSGPKVLG